MGQDKAFFEGIAALRLKKITKYWRKRPKWILSINSVQVLRCKKKLPPFHANALLRVVYFTQSQRGLNVLFHAKSQRRKVSHPEFLGKYEFRKNMRRYRMYKTSRLRLLARIGRGQVLGGDKPRPYEGNRYISVTNGHLCW